MPKTLPKPRDWITQRRERLAGAIAYLRSCAVLCDQIDKRDMIASYWVSGVRQPMLADDIIALAKRKGWSE